MRTNIYLLSCFTLGLLVASCQNGLEEVIDESAVQDELANTRAEEKSSSDDLPPVVIPLVGDVDEIIANLRATSALVPLFGPSIIGGTSVGTYTVTLPPDKSIAWGYNTSLLTTATGSTTTGLKLKLINSNTATDTAVIVYIYNDDGSLYSYDVIYVGLNGPHANDCSMRILRSSDSVEVSPYNLSPNTYYQAYFSTTTGGSNMSLSWSGSGVSVISNNGYYCTFLTGTTGYGSLTVSGSMPSYGVNKTLLNSYLSW